MRNRYYRSLISSLLTTALLLVTITASAADQSTSRPKTQDEKNNDVLLATGDALIARPLGLVATLIGAAVTIVSLPFTVFSDDAGEAANTLIGIPAGYTFDRPLGKLDEPLDRCGNRAHSTCRN